jgi:hypothetical protein
MTHHTPEPWAFSDTDHKDKDGVKSRFCELVNQTANFAHFRLFEVQNEEESKAVAILGCGPASYENARRIVACVNALVGWETETVEKYCTNGAPGNPNLGQKFDELQTRLKECQSDRQREHDMRVKLSGECEELKRQRDKLLKALIANHVWHKTYDDVGGYEESDLCEINTAAIATAAKGGEA